MLEIKNEITEVQLDNRKKWADALESGVYSQAKSRLRTSTGYCCLGVAEDVRGVTWSPNELGFSVGTTNERNVLTTEACAFYGLSFEDPIVIYEDRAICLTELNDSLGYTLPEIGAIIRSQDDDWDGTHAWANSRNTSDS